MKCPKCGNKKDFFVAISATAKYDAETDELSDYEDIVIDDRELVTCCKCDYVDNVEEFDNEYTKN